MVSPREQARRTQYEETGRVKEKEEERGRCAATNLTATARKGEAG